jgi:hypothetical protein
MHALIMPALVMHDKISGVGPILIIRAGQNRTYIHTVYDRTFGDFPAKISWITIHTV